MSISGHQEPRQRKTQVERSATARRKLIDAAIVLIAERGFTQIRLSDIAAASGMTRGAIQHHFEGREALMLAILEDAEQVIVRSFADVLIHPQMDLPTRIGSLIDHLGAVARSQTYLAVVDIWIATRGDPALKEAVRQSVLRSTESYRKLWQRAFGDIAPAEAISDCRRVVVSVLRGAVMTRIFVAEPRSFDPTLVTLKSMVIQHMGAQKPADQ